MSSTHAGQPRPIHARTSPGAPVLDHGSSCPGATADRRIEHRADGLPAAAPGARIVSSCLASAGVVAADSAPSLTILAAYHLALQLHAGRVRSNGEPYSRYLPRVCDAASRAGMCREEMIASLLSDAVTGGLASPEQLRARGVPQGALAILIEQHGIEPKGTVR